MAITRAQQAKQMLRDGGRIGLKPGGPPGGGATSMGSGRDFSSGAVDTGDLGSLEANVAANQAARDYSDSSPVDTGDLGTLEANVAANIAARLGGSGRADPQESVQTLQRFLNRRRNVNVPTFFGQLFKKPIQKFADFNAAKNRNFFQKVIGAGKLKLGGKTIDLEAIGQMTDEELEDTYKDYLSARLNNEIDAYGNPLLTGDDESPFLFPRSGIMAQAPEEKEEDEDPINLRLLAEGGRAGFQEGGGIEQRLEKLGGNVVGGEYDFESARQMYGLGKLVKKITKSVKKIAKSPLGKVAIGAALFKFGPPLFKEGGAFNKFFFAGKAPSFGALTTKGALTGIAGISALGGLTAEEDDEEQQYAGADFPNPVDFYLSGQAPINTRLAAEGGLMRAGYQEGSKEPVAKKTMPLLDMGGMEKDYREEGGFVPIGRMEKADDVPARLSKNEFVFTADAVRNAGDGDVDLGAEKMYNMMKNLEAGGDVSEESQGLKGAREMFQTSQRLEEVL
jgi:hypothetical protein